MTDDPNRRHNGGPLSDEDARKLWNHIRAREVLNEQMDDVRLDIKARKELQEKDGFDNAIIDVILKRRKVGQGQTSAADNILQLYEAALAEQKVLPLEHTRRAREADERRTVDEIADQLHGEEPPDGVNIATEAAKNRLN